MFVEGHAEIDRAVCDVLAMDRRREREVLQFLFDAGGSQSLQARWSDQSTRGEEPAQFVAGIQRLVEPRDTRASVAEIVRVRLDRIDHVVGITAFLQDRRPLERMVGRIGPALIIEVMEQPDGPPFLFVLTKLAGIRAASRFDREHVLDEAFAVGVFTQ